MKKLFWTTLFLVILFRAAAVPAAAADRDTVKVGLYFGSSALYSANLENDLGGGFDFGYFDKNREFIPLGRTEHTQISMTAAGDIYMNGSGAYSPDIPSGGYRFLGGWHAQFDGFGSFEEAADFASSKGGYPAWINGAYVVRCGSYSSFGEAQNACDQIGGVPAQSVSGVIVTVTRTEEILFEFDGGESLCLGIRPDSFRGSSAAWFKNRRYAGAFAYDRSSGGNLNVINVVDLEDYVKGVIPYEMGGDWPQEALAAQAVCARTFVCGASKHQSLYGFDVCNGSDCQVYYGLGNSSGASPSAASDQAVEETAGLCLYYNGALVRDAVYHASNGGATESSVNVFGGEKGYLIGKEDPYEARTSIPNYRYSVTYTAAELSWILDQKGYSVGTVTDVYISAYTPAGNVKEVTFEGTSGTRKFTGNMCSSIFYSSTYNKSVRSMRFDINGSSAGTTGSSGGVYVNNGNTCLPSLDGVSVISGSGYQGVLNGDSASALTSSGTAPVTASGSAATAPIRGHSSDGTFTITGAGNGHNVGMSQYGAKAMAEMGYGYEEILRFYYTDVTIA